MRFFFQLRSVNGLAMNSRCGRKPPDSSMKIVHVIDSGGLYGAEQMLLALVAEQLRQGLKPMILSITVPQSEPKAFFLEAQRRGLPVISWPMAKGFNLCGAAQLLSWCQVREYFLVHSHGYRFDILFNCLPRRNRQFQFISTVHGFTAHRRFSRVMVYQWLNRVCLLRGHRVVAVSQGLQKQLRHRAGVAFIPNGLPSLLLDQTATPIEAPQGPFLLALGRLSVEKAYHRLIGAFADSNAVGEGWHVVIAGEGNQKELLQALVKKRGLEARVHFVGYTHDAQAWLQQAAGLVISSDTEGLPMVLLEAMRLKTPVIATPVGEIPQVLKNGALGFLAAACDQQSLTASINRLLSEPEQAAAMKKAARHCFEEHYTAEVMARRYHSVYRELLKNDPVY
ncbi:MAG: glycosyltransferase [Halomonadaceae bacterium]|nr:MAG: glycosyltransferase [Halomonadaceae bacterium]